MMDKAFQGDIIPVEQFAKRGSQATGWVLTSGLFCDIAWALHKTAAIESVDLANCYDAVAHPIASIALQSFKVHKVMVAMMLYVLGTRGGDHKITKNIFLPFWFFITWDP
jgi:hypothetical protein